jgi:uncharacterized HhH-GPD family protein
MTVELHLAQDAEADRLLSESPLALVIGMVLDQQIPLEKAFTSPAVLAERMGRPLNAATIAATDPTALEALFKERPALHRFPGSMAARVQEVCRVIAEDYGNRAEDIWLTATSGAELVGRLKALPGFGDHKARIFAALLGKQLGVRPDGWQKASTPFGDDGKFLSVADITDSQTLDKVRATKAALKAKAKAKAKTETTAKTTAKAGAGA